MKTIYVDIQFLAGYLTLSLSCGPIYSLSIS